MTISNALAALHVSGGSNFNVFGGLQNDGLILINPAGVASTTNLVFFGAQGLSGTGTVRLNGAVNRAQIISNSSAAVITHGTSHTIAGVGQVFAPMNNDGLITADVPGGELALLTNPKSNNATMLAANGGSLLLDSLTVTQSPDAEIVADGPASTVKLRFANIIGGHLDARNAGSVVATDTSTLDGVSITGTVTLTDGKTLNMRNGPENNGVIVINPTNATGTTSMSMDGQGIAGVGLIRLLGSGARAQILSAPAGTPTLIGAGQRLEGIGRLAAPVTIRGALAPGLSVGTIDATAPVAFAPEATFEAEVSGNELSDRLASTSSFEAGGTLRVVFVDGFAPPLRWATTIVTSASRTGTFAAVEAPQPTDARLAFRVIYSATTVRIGAFCKADNNFDGTLNIFDIQAFIGLYNAQDASADLAGPFGTFNIFDLQAYINLYNAGCP